MLDHLREQCLALTSTEKRRKLKQIELEWKPEDDLQVFLLKVQKLKEELEEEYDLTWEEDMRMTHVVSELAESNVFTEEELANWEDKPKNEKTYAAMVAYFTRFYDRHKKYGGAGTAKSQGFESTANLSEQGKEELMQMIMQVLSNQKEVAEAATADKEHLQAMDDSNEELMSIIKKLNVQNEKLADQNTKLVEQNNTLASALAKAKSPRGGGGGGGGGRNKNNSNGNDTKPRKKCAICAKFGHEAKDCYELERNKDKRTDNWKSVFE